MKHVQINILSNRLHAVKCQVLILLGKIMELDGFVWQGGMV